MFQFYLFRIHAKGSPTTAYAWQAFWVVVSVVVGGIYFEECDELYGSHIAAVVAGERLMSPLQPLFQQQALHMLAVHSCAWSDD